MGGGKQEHLLIAIPMAEPKGVTDKIRKEFPHIKVTYINAQITWADNKAPEVPPELWSEITMLGTLTAIPSTPDQWANLSFLQTWSAGVNHLESRPIYKTDIALCTSSGIHGPAISEWVIMTALVHNRLYNGMHDWQKQRYWPKMPSREGKFGEADDFVGQRMAVLGYGSIGRQAARVGKAMGMDIIAFTATPKDTKEKKKDQGYWSGMDKSSLHEFLKQDIDVLLISLPLTKETKGLLGKEEFEILGKRNAFISNISRGQVLVQDDLIAALKEFKDTEGKKGLRGAALDVADPEPLPKESPLWDAPNCIITPHMSGLGKAYGDRCAEILHINVRRHLNGERLLNEVDKKRGY